uniref:Non-structural maintenance of chromosomes element 4 n=1 Tax=Grammatophora oceanica TaxID=210454 RepID=A0A7S1Y271_9STRA|eukprot:CAMPEP_0194042500 /NCGR_PEP_ID=MMETSP0009_2-20130614/14268_1 /TAXON_ID=210454 /ORGANISM="Grammatophora oceanica, Strain CCMP 410" /LENGTH=332 /DNA_ID=CAMNT_0038686365 /DNA_START=16 /DNA_END=1014 /DNA_ORIENTATION=+
MDGQTEEERRKIRQSYRELQKELVTNGEKMEDPDEEAFHGARKKNNKLFKGVQYTREAVLDGENLEMIANKAVTQADRLMEVPRYDPIKFQQKLKSHFSTGRGQFDWLSLGKAASVCFNMPPTNVSFLSGPLQADYEPKQKKARQARKKPAEESDAEEEEPEDVKKQERSADNLSEVEKNIKELYKVLKKKCHQEQKNQVEQIAELPEDEQQEARKELRETEGEIDGLQYLFNPNSFTQTVENLFHFSFMIKDGRASMRLDDETGLRVRHVGDVDGDQRADGTRQTITSLSMRDWRKLTKAHGMEEGYLKHRVGSRHSRGNRSVVVDDSDEE